LAKKPSIRRERYAIKRDAGQGGFGRDHIVIQFINGGKGEAMRSYRGTQGRGLKFSFAMRNVVGCPRSSHFLTKACDHNGRNYEIRLEQTTRLTGGDQAIRRRSIPALMKQIGEVLRTVWTYPAKRR